MATNTSKIKTNLGELELAHYTNEDGIEIILFNSLKVQIGQIPGISFGKPEFQKTTDLEGKGEILCNVCVTRKLNNEEIPYWGFGEVSLKNLESNIAMEYSYTMAKNRALSDAFLVLLGLSGRYYSSEQITSNSNNLSDNSPDNSKEQRKEDNSSKSSKKDEEEYEKPFEKPLTFPPLEENDETENKKQEKEETSFNFDSKKKDEEETFVNPFEQ